MVELGEEGGGVEVGGEELVVVAVVVGGEELVAGELGLGAGEVDLELAELVLEEGDDADAAVDGVPQAHVGLVRQRVHRVLPLLRLQLVQQLRHVARPEHLVHVRKLGRLVRRKIRREHALRLALSPQELARRARRRRPRPRPPRPSRPPRHRRHHFLSLDRLPAHHQSNQIVLFISCLIKSIGPKHTALTEFTHKVHILSLYIPADDDGKNEK